MAAHRKRASRKPWILSIAFALLAGLFVVPTPANASGGEFICQAVVGRLGSGHYGMVNGDSDGNPAECADGYFGLNGPIDLGVAQIYGYEAYTSEWGHSAYASAATIVIVVGRIHITLTAVEAKASAGCNWLHQPFVASSSKIVGLRINGGSARALTGYTKINVLGLVVLELNKTTTHYYYGKQRTQQALVLSSSTTPRRSRSSTREQTAA